MIIRIQQEPAGAVFEFEIDGTLVTLRNLYDIVAARIKDSVPEGQVFFLDGLAEITYRHRNPAIGLRTPYCRGMVRPTSETVCDYLKECTVYDVFACKAPYDTRILLSVATNCELAALETIVDFVLGEPSPVTLKTLFGKGREEYVVKLSQDLVVTKPVGYGEPPDDTVYPHVVDFGAMPLPTQRDILLSVLGVLLRPDQNVIVQSSPDVKKYFIYTGSTARVAWPRRRQHATRRPPCLRTGGWCGRLRAGI